MIGPGRYDDLCTKAREEADAKGAILIIHQGRVGSGFSAQLPPNLVAIMPEILRDVADQIEADFRKGKL